MAQPIQIQTCSVAQVRARLLAGMSAVAALCAIGCGIDDDSPAEPSPLEASSPLYHLGCGSLDGGQIAPDSAVAPAPDAALPNATPTFKAAKTSGAKCQATTRVSADGKELSIAFEDFSVALTPEQGVSSEVCNVTMDLVLPNGRKVAVEQLEADADANLGRGVVGSVESSLSFVTSLVRVAASATTVTGPLSGPLTYRGVVAPEKRLFSSCSNQQKLTAHLRLALVNGEVPSTGTLALTKLLPLKLALRPCN